MVAVAHQVEHRIVAPEVAGSRPVSHPNQIFVSLAGWPGRSLRFSDATKGIDGVKCVGGCEPATWVQVVPSMAEIPP